MSFALWLHDLLSVALFFISVSCLFSFGMHVVAQQELQPCGHVVKQQMDGVYEMKPECLGILKSSIFLPL